MSSKETFNLPSEVIKDDSNTNTSVLKPSSLNFFDSVTPITIGSTRYFENLHRPVKVLRRQDKAKRNSNGRVSIEKRIWWSGMRVLCYKWTLRKYYFKEMFTLFTCQLLRQRMSKQTLGTSQKVLHTTFSEETGTYNTGGLLSVFGNVLNMPCWISGRWRHWSPLQTCVSFGLRYLT